jgi:hypothetical protein
VVRFYVNVVYSVGARFDSLKVIRGGSMEEVADAFLAFVFDDTGGHVIGCMEERLGEGKGGALSAAATEAFVLVCSVCCSKLVCETLTTCWVIQVPLIVDRGSDA